MNLSSKGGSNMADLSSFLSEIQQADFHEKNMLLNGLLVTFARNRAAFTEENRASVLNFVFQEIEPVRAALQSASSFRQKYELITYHGFLMHILPFLVPDVNSVDERKLREMDDLTALVIKENVIEVTVDRIFEGETILDESISELIFLTDSRTDEFERGILYKQLLEHKDKLPSLSRSSRQMLSDFTLKEFTRCLNMDHWSKDCLDALEMAADAVSFFGDDKALSALTKITEFQNLTINYFALQTLLERNFAIPAHLPKTLAKSLEFAHKTYRTLLAHGKADLFPREYMDEIYLAKSNMVDWLLYPTELNQAPDEIEYIGKITYLFRKQIYHVFKFRSDSQTLLEEDRNRWLIGWANDDGDTFSQFEHYDKFDKGTTEKTLRAIKRKAIGK